MTGMQTDSLPSLFMTMGSAQAGGVNGSELADLCGSTSRVSSSNWRRQENTERVCPQLCYTQIIIGSSETVKSITRDCSISYSVINFEASENRSI